VCARAGVMAALSADATSTSPPGPACCRPCDAYRNAPRFGHGILVVAEKSVLSFNADTL
jgi:hypothetical protein